MFLLSRSSIRLSAVIAFHALLLNVLPVHAQEQDADASPASERIAPSVVDLTKRYPAGTINSSERAESALEDVKKERAEVEARLKKAQRECTKKFLVTKCRDEAKAQRRIDRQQLKLIENEAARFQRQQKVIDRDRALAEKREKEEADAEKRTEKQEKYDKKQAQSEAKKQEDASGTGALPAAGTPAGKKTKGLTSEERAENVKAYEKKLEEVEKNKKKVASRKAENEKKRAKKKAKAAKEKEKAAADAAKMKQLSDKDGLK